MGSGQKNLLIVDWRVIVGTARIAPSASWAVIARYFVLSVANRPRPANATNAKSDAMGVTLHS
jgi:hypothetical protein